MIALQVLLVLFCLLACAFFAGMETGVISIHRMRLRHFVKQGDLLARLLQGFIDDWDRLLGTALVGTNLATVVASVLAASLFSRALPVWGEAISTIVMAVVILVACEYTPKMWFRERPIERCRRFVGVLRVSEILFMSFAWAIVTMTRWMTTDRQAAFSKPAPFVTRDDLKVLAREGERDGVLSKRERDMIHGVFELAGKRAKEIMVPRRDMVTTTADTSIADFFERVRRSGYTRLPVQNAAGEFTGVVNFFYVMSVGGTAARGTVGDHTRPALFINEDMAVDDIFPRMRRFRQPMCLVKDAEGRCTGLVTTEDVLEEIVGEL